MYRRRLSTQVDTDLLRLLLIPNPENESIAAEIRVSTYTHKGPIAVIVVGTADAEVTADVLSVLTVAMRRAAEQPPSEAFLAGVFSDLGVLLSPLRASDDLTPAHRVADRLVQLTQHLNHDIEVVAAIGGSAELEHASHSYVEARRTMRIMRAMPDLRPVAAWEDLGVFRALALVPQEEAADSVIDKRVRELLADKGLAATAELFLDLAGDVQKTAAQLFVHRTTLYQRLDRIATLYKLDLRRSGDHRLVTHLGLKLARITAT